MSIPNNWGDWRPNLTPHTGDLQATDLIECTMIVGGVPVNTAITGQQIIDAASGGGLTTADRMVIVGRNSTGVTLYAGTIIYISGSTGNRPNYVKAQANTEATSAGTFGVIVADIANNSDGNALIIGTLDNLDTRAVATHPFTTDTLVDGDTLYLSPTVAGYVTRVKPSAPNHIVYVGKVIRTSPTLGTIVYRIQNGYELNEIHDVEITSVANNDLIQYDSASLLWKNRSLLTAGIQPTLVSGTNIKTINSTSLLGSGNIAISSGLTVGTTAITSGTVGRVLFEGTGNVLQQSAGLSFATANNQLTIGTSTYLRGGTSYLDSFASGWGLYNCGLQSTFYGNNKDLWNLNTLSIGFASATARLDVRAQGALSTDIAFRVRNSANTFDRLSVTGTAFSIITSSRAEMSVTANAVNFGLDNHTVTFTHSSPGQVLQTQRSNWTAMAHFATLGLTNTETLTEGSTIFGATIRTGTLTNVQNKMHFVCDTAKWGLAGTYSAGFQWYKGTSSGDAAFSTSVLPSITTANRQMWLTPESSLLLSNTTGITYTTNVDSFQMYSNDIVGGNAAPHFRTENGNIIKLYQQATGGAASTFVVGVGTAVNDASTFDGYTLGQIVKALRNTGILA